MREGLVNLWVTRWRSAFALLFVIILAGLIVLPKLGSLVPSTTQAEHPASLGITTSQGLIDDPFFLPERVIQASLLYLDQASGTALRLVSVFFAAAALICMYWLLSMWHTRRVAILGLLLFVSSSWFLHQARWAEPSVLYLLAVPILLIGSVLLKRKRYDYLWPFTLFFLALLLYLPGVWLLTVLFLAGNFDKIRKTFKYASVRFRVLSIATFIGPLIPLVYSLWHSPWLIKTWTGLPENGPYLRDILQNLYEIPKQLFVSGLDDPLRWLSGTPILDAATVILMVIGIYSYQNGLHPIRWRVLAGLSLVSFVLVAIGGFVTLSLLIPLAYIFASNGIAMLLQQWFTIFPRNPFARSIGITMVSIVVLTACTYQLTRYYIGWPHAAGTYNAVTEQTN